MAEHKSIFPIVKMSEVFKVPRSGYYSWMTRPPSDRAKENQRLTRRIKQVWLDSGKTYGSPRIHQQLLRDGETASRPRVARLMKKEGIQSQIRPKWVTTTDSKHSLPVAPNRLDQEFSTSRLGQVWVSDITYIPSTQGWLYLTTIMDLADRQILGWSLSEGMSADETIIPAWKAACQKRTIEKELIFHSDRGIQYCCQEFSSRLAARPLVRQSMSRKGNCWDNAPAESFFKTFKAELPIEPKHYNYNKLRQVIFNFIEIWYNRQRLHSTLDYCTPAEMQDYLTQQQELAA
ncbi:IS3 family transposase [Aliifodinibius salipaludis]|uniref:IS3 family transposase n=1 Tax=Fodinibius salipaludis TaxID=2032627 RepID=A0A2A2G4K5_9BACT|nr:IS3 family transposase [Aliifodinibius salipaludis]PAU92706.1 IS3 family transposase [Aliifodinibius salipaludis]